MGSKLEEVDLEFGVESHQLNIELVHILRAEQYLGSGLDLEHINNMFEFYSESQ